MHIGAQRDLVLRLDPALGVGDHLAREALGIILIDHLLDVGRHRSGRQRVLHDRDADRAHVGLLTGSGVLLLVGFVRRKVCADVEHFAVLGGARGADELDILQLAIAILPPAALAVQDVRLCARVECGAACVWCVSGGAR
eukprot:4923283-Prymnesium_polylepis.1